MTTDLPNLAAFAAFLACLVGLVRFASTRPTTTKESAMYGNLSREKPARAQHIHNARVARDLMHPVRPVAKVEGDGGDPLDFTFDDVDRATEKANKRARMDFLAAQTCIPWRHLTDDEIAILRNQTAGFAYPDKVARRASVAWSKRYSRDRRAALRGGGK